MYKDYHMLVKGPALNRSQRTTHSPFADVGLGQTVLDFSVV